jgi:hypothetical protein
MARSEPVVHIPRRRSAAALLTAAVLVLTAAPATTRADEPGPAPAGTTGMRVHRDPATGRFVPPPPAEAVPRVGLPVPEARGLVEEPGRTPAGGTTVRLQGRFQAEERVQVAPDGTLRARCTTGAAGAPGR